MVMFAISRPELFEHIIRRIICMIHNYNILFCSIQIKSGWLTDWSVNHWWLYTTFKIHLSDQLRIPGHQPLYSNHCVDYTMLPCYFDCCISIIDLRSGHSRHLILHNTQQPEQSEISLPNPIIPIWESPDSFGRFARNGLISKQYPETAARYCGAIDQCSNRWN